MKNIIITAAALFFLLSSCGNKKGSVETTTGVADLTDSTTHIQDTILIEEIPGGDVLPPAVDEPFDDFIYSFAANEKFQRNRIVFPLSYNEGGNTRKIEKKDWEYDDFFIKQNYYTLLFNSEEELDKVGSDVGNSAQLEWIYLKTYTMKVYSFMRVKKRWRLESVDVRTIGESRKRSFIDFYAQFSIDSLHQAKHIESPLEFITSDPDDDFSILETTLDVNQWFAFRPVLPTDRLSNITYNSVNNENSPNKILQLKGIGNGFLNTLFFRQRNGDWELYKFEDTSN